MNQSSFYDSWPAQKVCLQQDGAHYVPATWVLPACSSWVHSQCWTPLLSCYPHCLTLVTCHTDFWLPADVLQDIFTHLAKPCCHRPVVPQQAFIYPWLCKSLWISSGISKSFWIMGEGDEIIWISNLEQFSLSKAIADKYLTTRMLLARNTKMQSICRCNYPQY